MTEANSSAGSLLCVSNFSSNVGFAWTFFEELIDGMASDLVKDGIETFVAYPRIIEPPRALASSPAVPIELAIDLGSWDSVRELSRFIETHNVRVLYMYDRPSWHAAYAYLKANGLRRIVVYDHTSGKRTPPRGLKRVAKKLAHRIPGVLADDILAVSDFVLYRKAQVELIPPGRMTRVWNSLDVDSLPAARDSLLRTEFGISPERVVFVTACRATREKGIQHLLNAFESLCQGGAVVNPPALVYLGDGPMMEELASLRDSLTAKKNIILAGYREDTLSLTAGADVCVVPSVWQEAFGLAALEPMALGIPVIASTAGGLPEVVLHEVTGLLVPPGDELALAEAMRRLAVDSRLRRELGRKGVDRVRAHFARDQQLGRLINTVRLGFA